MQGFFPRLDGSLKKYEICPKALHKLFSVNRSYKFYLKEWVIVCHTHNFSWLHVFTFFLPWKLQAPPSQCHHRLRCRKILWLYNHVMWHSGPSEQEKLAQSELWLVDEPIGFSGWQRRAEIRSPWTKENKTVERLPGSLMGLLTLWAHTWTTLHLFTLI